MKLITLSSHKQTAHFLHVGKTGGTAVKEALGACLDSGKYTLKLHRHKTTLADIPEGEKVFFFLRDPVTRFVSGFYSRYRKGAPRYNRPWNADEQYYFTRFQTPNALALSLSSADVEVRTRATKAMQSINHVKSCYCDWFLSREYFLSRIKDILFIGFQESLSADFNSLKTKLCLSRDVSLPMSTTRAHKTPDSLDKNLDKTAVMNLQKHYADDIDFLHVCSQLHLNRSSLTEKTCCLLWNLSPFTINEGV